MAGAPRTRDVCKHNGNPDEQPCHGHTRGDTLLGHPKGLFLLFATEMWERFSYYGMRALLVLSMVAGAETANPGFGWTSAEALRLYGLFTGFVYFTPLIGAGSPTTTSASVAR